LQQRLKEFVVKIEYNGKSGSGVIVKLGKGDSRIAGILTVSHLFQSDSTEENDDEFKSLKISESDINIITECHEKLSLARDYIFIHNDEHIDLAIILVSISNHIDTIPTLKLYNLDVMSSDTLYVAGFSNHRQDLMQKSTCDIYDTKLFDLTDSNMELRYVNGGLVGFYDSDPHGIKEFIEGMSGGGVFIENNGNIYLLGIQKKVLRSDLLIATSLGDIYELIDKMITFINNEILSKSDNLVLEISNIEFETSLLTNTTSFDLSNIDIGVLSNELDKKQLDFARDDIIDSKSFNKVEREVSSKRTDLENKLADIADFYAWSALFFSKRHDYRRVTTNLKKAISLNNNYEKILLTEKLNRTSDKKEIYKNILAIEKSTLSKRKGDDRIDALEKIIELQEKIDSSDYNEIIFNYKKMISIIKQSPDNHIEKLELYSSKARGLIERQYFGDDQLEERSYKLAELYDELGLKSEAYYHYYLLTEVLRNRGNALSERFSLANQKIKNILLDTNSGLTTAKLLEMNEKAQEEVNKVINSAGGIEQWNAYHEVKEIRGLVSKIENLIQTDPKSLILHSVVEQGFKNQSNNIETLETAMGSLKESFSTRLNDLESFLATNKANYSTETTGIIKLIKEDFSGKINSMEEKLTSGLSNNNQADFIISLKNEFELFSKTVEEKLSELPDSKRETSIQSTHKKVLFPWVLAGLSIIVTLVFAILYFNEKS
jgi:hypothetical protein